MGSENGVCDLQSYCIRDPGVPSGFCIALGVMLLAVGGSWCFANWCSVGGVSLLSCFFCTHVFLHSFALVFAYVCGRMVKRSIKLSNFALVA